MINFKPIQIQSSCRQQSNSDSKIEICVGKNRKHCGGKGENAGYQHLAFFSRGVKSQDCVLIGLSNFKVFADDSLLVTPKLEICFRKGRNHCG